MHRLVSRWRHRWILDTWITSMPHLTSVPMEASTTSVPMEALTDAPTGESMEAPMDP